MPRGMAHGSPFRRWGSPEKRLKILTYLVRALIQNERLEAPFGKVMETQKYANRIIDIARYSPDDKYRNDMVDYWTGGDEEIKDKLFNVLIPRFQEKQKTYTRVAPLPMWYNPILNKQVRMGVIEYIGNPLPPLPIKQENPHSLQNVLIAAAKDNWFKNNKSV